MSEEMEHAPTAEELARHFRDMRKDWKPGPWDHEPDRVEWRHAGYPCLISRGGVGSWCGYVGVPPGHPWHGKHYEAIDASAHGGLTYADSCGGLICHVPRDGEPADVWWVGFDCGHAFDLSPSIASRTDLYERLAELDEPHSMPRTTYKDVDYVTAETNQLAEQAAEAAKAEP